MFAVYAERPNPKDPLASLVVGDRPEAEVPDGWVRVKISHASLNRHDLFTLRGITAQPDPILFPMILGNDSAGTLDDGTPVVIYPVMGSDDWRDDETLDPGSHSARGYRAPLVTTSRYLSETRSLPRKVRAVIDNIGPASWEHSMASVARGGTGRDDRVNDRP
jgi:hypothetical protein